MSEEAKKHADFHRHEHLGIENTPGLPFCSKEISFSDFKKYQKSHISLFRHPSWLKHCTSECLPDAEEDEQVSQFLHAVLVSFPNRLIGCGWHPIGWSFFGGQIWQDSSCLLEVFVSCTFHLQPGEKCKYGLLKGKAATFQASQHTHLEFAKVKWPWQPCLTCSRCSRNRTYFFFKIPF